MPKRYVSSCREPALRRLAPVVVLAGRELDVAPTEAPEQQVVQQPVRAGGVAVLQGGADIGDGFRIQQGGQLGGGLQAVRGQQFRSPAPVVVGLAVHMRQQGLPDLADPAGGQRRRPSPSSSQ